jgi:FADH2 O2-dependent halogenase
LKIPSTNFADLPETRVVYAHFRNVARIDGSADFGEMPPYPPDDAAVHHVFDDGWIWVLRFNNGITSAGAAFRSDADLANEAAETIWRRLLARFPSIAQQFAGAETVTAFYSLPQVSFRRTQAAGKNWALLPAAAGFVDPLLSSGFALNLLGIMRLARIFRQHTPDCDAYERDTFAELEAAADLIGALYAKMNSFPEFASLSYLYFAALSYTETAWRLGKEALAQSFLLSNNPEFVSVRRRFCAAARGGRPIDPSAVAKAIEPWNIAGLANPSAANWYPVSFEDLKRAPEKLNASRTEIKRLVTQLW